VTELRDYYATDTMIDGRSFVIRAIRPEDKQALQDGIRRQSAESVYFRFFRPKRHLSDTELAYLTELDFVDHVALGAQTREKGVDLPIGVGRYIVNDPTGEPRSAELAVMVDDAYQGRGVGKALLRHLIVIAQGTGIERFVATVLPDNQKMLAVFASTGLPVRKSYQSGLIDVSLLLSSQDYSAGETPCNSADA
jgi:RimJ/RimL family protein N-acetyltransferase